MVQLNFGAKPGTEYWYRLEEQRYAPPLDEYDEPVGRGQLVVHVCKLKVLRHTPKGAWLVGLQYGEGNPRFVLREGKKRFACPTLEDATASFLKRKERHARILRAQLETVEEASAMAKSGRTQMGIDW